MEKQNTGKGSLQRTYSMDLTKRAGKRPLERVRSFDPVRRGKFQRQEILVEEAMQDIKEKGIQQQELTKQQDVDISVLMEEDKKAIYKMPDEKLQISSDQGKSENVENQGQTVLEKRDDELNREAKQLALRWEHITDSIKKQAQSLTKSEKAIWGSNELTIEQKRDFGRSLEAYNQKFVEANRTNAQYIMKQLQRVANEQATTNHLKKRSEGN